jgi:hypothetical protein
MIAAVSAAVSAGHSRSGAASGSTTTGWYYVQVPDLNTGTHRDIGKAKAGWTFTTICRLLHHVGRVGTPKARKAAKADQRLGVGLSAIANESGQSENKVRRDCRQLEALGLIVLTHPNVVMVRDAEGKLKTNRVGRSKATVIHLTITQDHVRQTAAKPSRMAGLNPSRMEGLPVANSVHPGGAIQTDLNTKRTPDGDAAGVRDAGFDFDAPLDGGGLGVDGLHERGRWVRVEGWRVLADFPLASSPSLPLSHRFDHHFALAWRRHFPGVVKHRDVGTEVDPKPCCIDAMDLLPLSPVVPNQQLHRSGSVQPLGQVERKSLPVELEPPSSIPQRSSLGCRQFQDRLGVLNHQTLAAEFSSQE